MISLHRARFILAVWFISTISAQAATVTRTTAYDYDASGTLIKEIIEPDSSNLCLVTVYTLDAGGNRTATTSRNCNGSVGSQAGTNSEVASPASNSDAFFQPRTENQAYDATGRFESTTGNALGHSESKTWNAAFGTLASITGPNGLTTSWSYDTFGRELSETRPESPGQVSSYAYCGSGITCPDALAKYAVTVTRSGYPLQRNYYDQLNRLIRTETQDKDGNAIYVQTQYDHLGRLYRTSEPFKSTEIPVWTTVTYDILDRQLSVTRPDGSVTSVAYNGLTSVFTNPKSQTRTEIRNSLGQLVRVTDHLNKAIIYKYDGFGNLLQVKDSADNITASTYDVRGRRTLNNDPDQGSWSYSYDVLGQLKRQTDAKAQVMTISYDKLGRPLQRNEPDLVTTWSYDVCDATLNPGGKCIGKPVKQVTDNGYSRTYLYDIYGRPTSELDNVGSGFGVTHSYDANGRISQRAYPTGLNISHVYSATGFLTQVKNASTQVVYWQANNIDAKGRVTSESYANGLTNLRTYNANTGTLTQVRAGTSATPGSTVNQTYTYDAVNNLTQRYDAVTGLNESFGYDNLNRLTATSAQVGSGTLTQVTLAYDALGNITSKSDVGTYTYGVLVNGVLTKPHAVTKIMMADGVTQYAAYTYDANGNMLTGAGRTFTWKSWNMPTSITGTLQGKSTPTGVASSSFGFVYNGEHERVKETLPDGTIIYNISPRIDTGIHVEKRVDTNGTVTYVNNLYAGDYPFGTLTTITPSGGATTTQVRYYHKDSLGSLIAITDESGALVERRSYDAWGKRRNLNGTSYANAFVTPAERHGYTGHEELDDVGLIHMNGRVYDPAIARFASVDPIIQFPDDQQSYNGYTYLFNNPFAGTDPGGFCNTNDEDASCSMQAEGGTPTHIYVNIGGTGYTGTVGPITYDPLPDISTQYNLNNLPSWMSGPWINNGLSIISYDPGFIGSIATGIQVGIDLSQGNYTDAAIGAVATVVGTVSNAGAVKQALTAAVKAAEIKTAKEVAEKTANAARREAATDKVGRAGKQSRLRELANDDKLGSADRGWIKQELNSIERGQRSSIRNPPGMDLAHERGREAAKGYDYKHSNLQDRDLHRLQHKYDDFGRANIERPLR